MDGSLDVWVGEWIEGGREEGIKGEGVKRAASEVSRVTAEAQRIAVSVGRQNGWKNTEGRPQKFF